MIASPPRALALELFEGTGHILGQEKARKRLAILLERQKMVQEGRLLTSNGAILAGRSGSGKTYMARAMCRLSGLPYAEVDANHYTESGYAGLNLSQALLPLLQASARLMDEQSEARGERELNVLRRDDLASIIEFAQTGVVIVDEFDKWTQRRNHVTGSIDTPIQAEFLKMVEGSDVYVSDDEDEIGVLIDTRRILFICGGAFVGLTNLVRKHMRMDSSQRSEDTFWEHVQPRDFVSYGLLPELAGRLSTHIFLAPLKVEHLADILMQREGLVAEYRSRFEKAGVEWAVREEGVRQLASIALSLDMGARGLESVCWNVFGEALFDASAKGARQVVLQVNDVKARLVA